ncbi:MAG: amino acid ABC transporter substrate-binding protein [Acidimicrobiia bacterium]|nr:amino acid ABC transporter substrate-binding protein [Acidimicrobiia bacterium]
MRKILTGLLAVGLVLAVSGVAAAGSKGPLKVATDLPAPGFWNGETPDNVDGGFEYDLADELADRLGYDGFELTDVSFDALVAGQLSGFDIALSQVTITDERGEVVDFTTPYFASDQGIMVNKGTKVNAKNAKKIQWGVQRSTTAQYFLKDVLKPKKKARTYKTTVDLFAALRAKQIDAVLLDTPIVLSQAGKSKGNFKVVAQFATGEEYGGILVKGSDLLADIDEAITALKDEGVLGELTDKNLGGDPSTVKFIEL